MEYINTLIEYFQLYPYIVVLLSFFLILLLFPIPEELILLTGGYLAACNQHSNIIWLPTLLAGILGIIITDYYFFLIFRIFGHKLINNRFFKRLFSHSKMDRIINYFHKFGMWTIFFVRFIPGGVRIPTFSIAGLTHLPHRKFLFATSIGALISSQITFWIGYWGKNKIGKIENLVEIISKRITYIILIIAVLIIIFFALKKILSIIKSKKQNKNMNILENNKEKKVSGKKEEIQL
jgi:membrane protein DedA with SNARE-associated domain